MKTNTIEFYDRYHKQNDKTKFLINRNNITYWSIIRLIERAVPSISGKMILDIGCGVGSLTFYLANNGGTVLGIDVSSRAIDLAKYTQLMTKSSNIKFIHAGFSGTNDIEVPHYQLPRIFDLVTCTEVIEHIRDDGDMLEECFRILKPGGIIVLTTQRDDSLIVKSGYFNKWDKRVGHLRRYSPPKLMKLLESKGFEVVFHQSADGLLRTIFYTTILGTLLRLIRGPLIPLFQWLDNLSIKLLGAADIQIIARKV